MNPNLESGLAILICEIFALILADNLQLGNQWSVLFCALKHETGRDQFQLARGPSEKSQK
jgi:hypothetical protein